MIVKCLHDILLPAATLSFWVRYSLLLNTTWLSSVSIINCTTYLYFKTPHFYILIMDKKVLVLCKKMNFEIFTKFLRFETPWVRKSGFNENACLSVCLSVCL